MTRAFASILLVWLALLVALAFAPLEPYALTNDGPQHLWAAAASLSKSCSSYSYLQPPTSNGAHQLLRALLSLGVSPLVALAVVTRVAALAVVVGVGALGLAWDRRRWPLCFLGCVFAQQLSVVVGLIPFTLGFAGALGVLAHHIWRRRQSRTPWFWTSLGLLGVAWCHIVPAAFAGVTLLALTLSETHSRQRELLSCLAAGLPSALVGIVCVLLPSGGVHAEHGALAQGGDGLFGRILPSSPSIEIALIVLALLAVLTALRARRTHRQAAAVALIASVFFCVPLVLAEDAFGWGLMAPRFSVFGCVLLITSLPIEQLNPRMKLVAAIVGTVLSAIAYMQGEVANARVSAGLTKPLLATSALPSRADHWAILISALPADAPTPARPGLSAWLHSGQAVAPAIGGCPVFSHDDTPSVHHLLSDRRSSDGQSNAPSAALWPRLWNAETAERRRQTVEGFAAWGATVDGFVGFGPAHELSIFEAQGHTLLARTTVDEDGNLGFSTRFVGCGSQVLLGGPASRDDIVDIGFYPAVEPILSFPLRRGRDAFWANRLPCGTNLWLRFRAQSCVESPPGDGRVAIQVVGQRRSAACSPADPAASD